MSRIESCVTSVTVFVVIAHRKPLTPLFEKERRASSRALIEEHVGPRRMHRPGLRSRFTANEYSMDVPVPYSLLVFPSSMHPRMEIEGGEQRLDAEEAHHCRNGDQLKDVAVGFCLVDDRRADPEIRERLQRVPAGLHHHHGLCIADALCQQ